MGSGQGGEQDCGQGDEEGGGLEGYDGWWRRSVGVRRPFLVDWMPKLQSLAMNRNGGALHNSVIYGS
jgi:hypothetical protein